MEISEYQNLFKRYFEGKATEAEKKVLMTWIRSQDNASDVKAEMGKLWDQYAEKETVFSRKEGAEILSGILHTETVQSVNSKIRRRRIVYAAAAVTLILVITIGIRFFTPGKPEPASGRIVLSKPDVTPGGNKAFLTLGNGTTISLDTVQNGTFAVQGKTTIAKLKTGYINYLQQVSRPSTRIVPHNILATPRGGQYEVVLPDGSKVWLNADSKLEFPTAFNDTTRTVTLRGEAYFDIAPNRQKPFWVNIEGSIGEMKIEVLGTRFNINAYTDEPAVKTSLVDGAVKVAVGNIRKRLKPGQQAKVLHGSSLIDVSPCDIDKAIAWKNGVFRFENDNIQTVMRQLARWYNVQIIYQGPIPPGHFTGIVDRNTNLSEVLKVLAISGVHFTIKERKIIVYS